MFNKALLVAFLSLTFAVNANPLEERHHMMKNKGSSSAASSSAASAVTSAAASAATLAAVATDCPAAVTVTVTAGAESSTAAAATDVVAASSTAAASTSTKASSSGSKSSGSSSSSSGSKSSSSSSGSKSSSSSSGSKSSSSSSSSGSKSGSSSSGSKSTTTTAAAAAASSSTAVLANTGAGNNAASGAAAGAAGDIQSSLTLDPSVIATGFANDGQDVPAAGQVASITSTNNFINFCAGQTITNGKQIITGSCNPAPMGQIAAQTVMPSSKFVFPTNFGTVQANTEFTIQMAISNLETGNFVNAAENYFAAPQQVNAQGQIIGHSHVVVEQLTSLDQTTPADPTKFVFFKGLNDAATNGVLSADVTAGLPAGIYKLSSINSAANHQPALVAVAQHGSLDDAIYFTVTDSGAGAAANSTAAAATTAAAAAATEVASTAAAAATSAAAASSTAAASALGDFGSCSVPQIKFAAGLDSRKETAFAPVDATSYPHGSADNIAVITDFMCLQLTNSCKADATAKATCATAQKAAAAATPALTGAQADAFNAAFGVKTAFSAVQVIDNTGKAVARRAFRFARDY